MKKYRRVMFPGSEEWCKVKRKTDSWFQKWHEEFGEFLPNHSKVQKFHFDWLFLSKLYEVWAKKIQRSYILWHWSDEKWHNWLGEQSLEHSKSEELCNDGLLLSKAFIVSSRKFERNYVSWHWRVMQNLKENLLVAWKIT